MNVLFRASHIKASKGWDLDCARCYIFPAGFQLVGQRSFCWNGTNGIGSSYEWRRDAFLGGSGAGGSILFISDEAFVK